MARNVLVDAGFLVALFNRRDAHHAWAAAQLPRLAPPWSTCEAALSEAYHLLGPLGLTELNGLLRDGALLVAFELGNHLTTVLRLIEKYADIPMSLAEACLVRMTEIVADPILLTTDSDFRIYRRHGRQMVPCMTPK